MTVNVASPPITCNPYFGKETFTLNLDLIESSRDYSHHHPLFSSSSKQITLSLVYDKTSPSFSIYQTALNRYNLSRTDSLTENVFYKHEHSFPRQFKSVSAFYGTVDGSSATSSDSFVRAFIHFVDCNNGHLYAFMRHQDRLYQVRPKTGDHQLLAVENVHEIVEVVSGADTSQLMFSERSSVVQNQLHKNEEETLQIKKVNKFVYEKKVEATENKYCSK